MIRELLVTFEDKELREMFATKLSCNPDELIISSVIPKVDPVSKWTLEVRHTISKPIQEGEAP